MSAALGSLDSVVKIEAETEVDDNCHCPTSSCRSKCCIFICGRKVKKKKEPQLQLFRDSILDSAKDRCDT